MGARESVRYEGLNNIIVQLFLLLFAVRIKPTLDPDSPKLELKTFPQRCRTYPAEKTGCNLSIIIIIKTYKNKHPVSSSGPWWLRGTSKYVLNPKIWIRSRLTEVLKTVPNIVLRTTCPDATSWTRFE